MTADRRRQGGFTLLELVVGIAILALITTVLVNVLGTGIAATSQVERRTERIERMRHVHDLLRQRLETARPAGSFVGGRQQPGFSGKAGALRFVSTAPPWPGIGGLVSGRLELREGRLVLSERPYSGAFDDGAAGEAAIVTTLARDIGQLQIDYFGEERQQTAWHREWREAALPELIRLKIAWRDGEAWPDLVVRMRLAPQPR